MFSGEKCQTTLPEYTLMSQMVVHVKCSHGQLNSKSNEKIIIDKPFNNDSVVHTLLTFVAVEVARDVNSFTSHDHDFVP